MRSYKIKLRKNMAKQQNIRPENIKSDFFVDSTCIDCGTCYWMAPSIFKRVGNMSAVYKDPVTDLEFQKSAEALLSCPTNSIGTKSFNKKIAPISKNFPLKISDNVYHTGFHSEKSYGAASYFIQDDNENILIDSPRYLKKLANNFKNLGGIKYQILTHKDDIADTDRYQAEFKSNRYIHKGDIAEKTKHYEIQLTGIKEIILNKNTLIIPVPGHTKGSVVILYKNKFLFTGDHLAFSPKFKHLYGFKNHCWYDLKLLIKSVEKLLDYKFTWILPGHGHPFSGTYEEVRDSLIKCINYLKK